MFNERPQQVLESTSSARVRRPFWITLGLALLLAAHAAAQESAAGTAAEEVERIPIATTLAVGRLGERSRSPYSTDALELELALGTWTAPEEGDELRSTTGEVRTWERFDSEEEGWFSGDAFRGGWAYATVEIPRAGAWRLDASGHAFVLVDGVPRYGDVYGTGWTRIPMWLDEGSHTLLFRCGRGRLRASFEPAPARVYLESRDRTLPDRVRAAQGTSWAGILVANAGDSAVTGWRIDARRDGDHLSTTLIPRLEASSQRKCAIRLDLPEESTSDAMEVLLELRDSAGTLVHSDTVSLRVREPDEAYRLTFLSGVDGSVQYFGVRPPAKVPAPGTGALLLTLHGAGVEADHQASCYRPLPEGWVIAPTNRRPYGFDWEDWGRRDALEVLALARARFQTDPQRTFLTGHSMGGHGTWQLGAHFPDRFAAIAPSAGWRDFHDYGGGTTHPEDAVGALIDRAANASRTLLLERNYLHSGVYVLHGDADETVPVSEARAMRSRLSEFHPDFAYYERPGAGHWWGNECMDWPPLVRYLEDHRLPLAEDVDEVEFVTVNPALSSTCHWVAVEASQRWMEPARVWAKRDAEAGRIELELDNVAGIALDLSDWSGVASGADAAAEGAPGMRASLTIVVNDQQLSVASPEPGCALRLRVGADGQVAIEPAPSLEPRARKGPQRAGPFKEAFGHRMVFVYGSIGTPEENAWSFAKARYDHETWRYRGNGSVDLVADRELAALDPDRSVILYGNRDTNAAWDEVLRDPAFSLERGRLEVAGRVLEGDELSLLAVHPRAGSDVASVALIGGTGLVGMRTCDFLSYFVSGVAYPDWTVLSPAALESGVLGFVGAGFFDGDWGTGPEAEAAWR